MTGTLAIQYCTFEVDDRLFGLDVDCVQEVLRAQDITRVPLAPPSVAGLMNLRGQIVLVLDLRTQLGLTPRDHEADCANVVLRTDEGPVSLLVDRIEGVVRPDPDCFEPTPEITDPTIRSFLVGIGKLDGRLLHVLDPKQAIEIATNPNEPIITGPREDPS